MAFEFEQRMNQPDAPFIQNPGGSISTHLMATEVVNGRWLSYPTIVNRGEKNPDGSIKLVKLGPKEAQQYALRTGEYKDFGSDKETAIKYGEGSWKRKGKTMPNTFKSLPQRRDVQDEVFQMVVSPDYTGRISVGPDQKITATRKTGVEETYFPTATAGKLDKFSAKLPGGPKIQASPGTGMDPDSIMRRRLEALKAHYKNKQSVLKGYKLSSKQHNSIVKNMQNEYDEQKFGMIAARLQVEDIKRGIAAGDIEQGAGEEAMLRLILPKEHVNTLFPKPGTERAPLSPSALAGHEKMQRKFISDVEKESPHFWLPQMFERRTQDEVIRQYMGWREAIGYDSLKPNRQRQLDVQWDMIIDDKGQYEWDSTSPQIKALRTYGNRLSRAIGSKISPFAKSVQIAKPKLRQPSPSVVPHAIPSPSKQLPAPRTEQEYNTLSSGTRYRGTDGQIRTKR